MLYKFLLMLLPCLAFCQLPGARDNRVLLPNGWWLSPAGEQIELGDFPMNAALSDDQHYLAVLDGGQSGADVRLIDLDSKKVVDIVKLEDSWQGIRFSGARLFVSGGYQNCVYAFDLKDGKLAAADTIRFELPKPDYDGGAAGLDVAKDRLAIVFRNDSTLRYVDLKSKKQMKTKLSGMPYSCTYAKGGILLVSIWSSGTIHEFDGTNKLNDFKVGDHPNEISLSANSHYAYVANANDNTVSVIDLKSKRTIGHVSTSIHPDSPEGSTTNSVTMTANSRYLLAANADNNSITVMKWQNPRHPRPVGFIPVGWYPTKVLSLKNGNVLVLNGKGGRSLPNPSGEYIGGLFKGSLSIFKFPGPQALAEYTKQVYENTPYNPIQKKEAAIENGGPIPHRVGAASPIKYVFYFVKENRTYDQVLGDMKEGNGDSSLCIFGDSISPNIHKLAREFVLFDNFYVDAEVSADGHNWATAAYATDYIEKVWPAFYGGRGGTYDFEGQQQTGHPKAGFIWDQCARQDVTYRSYGEFIESARKVGDPGTPSSMSLVGHFSPSYRGWDLDYSDVDRFKAWDKEFTEYEKSGDLPRFNIFHLPNDHTAGTARGKLSPKAYVAQNDFALGLFVERISHSKFWVESAIFVIEDDAQNGPDHIDAHRSVALVISPYTKRQFVDHSQYSGSSMLRTMELILGLPPMSQYDAAATPMALAFTSTPTLTPYVADSARYDLNRTNKEGDYGQNLMKSFNLTREDAVPDELFNEIIWRSIKGTPMPPPRYSIFSGPPGEEDDGE
ncbi:MAG TPA: bifunctional YncE family protein/alkaline phosphatase family protein [Bacteroidota bacterium]